MPFFILILLCTTFFPATAEPKGATPISPSDYQGLIGEGFSTNWFKSTNPLSKYHAQNIADVAKRGFQNVRLRSRADLYSSPYNDSVFVSFLDDLSSVVDDCLSNDVVPIISWIHHEDEANATDDARKAYVQWWTSVASHLKDKDYRLSFNLFTELGVDGCDENCGNSLRERTDKYNDWTERVVKAIRNSGGKNSDRILILASPKKTAKGLTEIDQKIYDDDSFMMVEWHTYASGPNKRAGSNKYWSGKGSDEDRQFLRNEIKKAKEFKLLTYFGAWMPVDNSKGGLDEEEVINFAKFFVSQFKNASIPWSLNVLDAYYSTKDSAWLTDPQDIKGQLINMSKVLDNIKDVHVMKPEAQNAAGCGKGDFSPFVLSLWILFYIIACL